MQSNFNRFFLYIVMPAILAITLFILSIFVIILPSTQRNIMDGKKEMLSELTSSVISLIEEYRHEEMQGLISRDSAKAIALERIRQIRYGEEEKDYFWITDHQPRMLMHPYRPELVGKGLEDYRDPKGKALFVESVQVVQKSGEGYVDYMWQWKDDPDRIVPKLSYVEAFEPWGWIVGTGIYLEDVRLEIRELKIDLLRLALLITLLILLLIGVIIRQSLAIERKRRRAEGELRLSREKYKSLVEASTEGTLMLVGGIFTYSNIRFRNLSGYEPSEVSELNFESLFELGWPGIEEQITDPKKTLSKETSLKCKDGSKREVVLSASRITYAQQTGFILVIKELSQRLQQDRDQEHLSLELQAALNWMNQPILHFSRDIKRCQARASVRDAARLMERKHSDLLLVYLEEEAIGVLTRSDLTTRVLSRGLDPETRVIEVMSAPLVSLPEEAHLDEAMVLMKKQEISHIAVKAADGRLNGILGYRDIAQLPAHQSLQLIRNIGQAGRLDELKRIYRQLPVLVSAMSATGIRAPILNRLIGKVADAIHIRILELAIEEMGPPPCRFAFMVMGSQGRGEQTLATDQDNAIIIEDISDSDQKKGRDYFQALAMKVSRDLDRVGYQKCRGNIMASNPEWNTSLASWKIYFSKWMSDNNPQDILNAAIFFDFRFLYGEESLVVQLREYVHGITEEGSVFFYHMAQSIARMKIPSGDMDLKKPLLSLTAYIRLYALKEKLNVTGSRERSAALSAKGIFEDTQQKELEQNLDFLTLLRIRSQLGSVSRNEPAANILDPDMLSSMEESQLKKCLADITALRNRLGTLFSTI